MTRPSSSKTVLIVPGFVVDVYSEIETAFVELCTNHSPGLRFVWLVPSMASSINRFAHEGNRGRLKEPIWVEPLRCNGITFEVGDISRFNAWHNFWLFRRVCRAHDVDAVYTHFGLERYWGVFLGKLLGKTTIWNEHWHSLGKRYSHAKRLFYFCCVDAFVAVSEYIARTLPRTIPIHVIPNAINTDGVGPVSVRLRNQARTKLGLPSDVVIVLMVAQFRRQKRHLLALEICQSVARRDPRAVFVFLGGGPMRGEFLRRAAQAGEGSIVAPGQVDNVHEYYSAADVCMLTSEDEPFGYCVLEAMKSRLPMVAFRSGGPAEILEDGETGVLVDEGDSNRFAAELGALIVDPERRHRLGSNAFRAVRERFNRDEWKKAIGRALSEAIRANR